MSLKILLKISSRKLYCNKIKIISVTRQIGLAVKAIITEASYESLRGENK